MRPPCTRRQLAALVAWAGLLPAHAPAAPFVPAHDDEVVERVPARPGAGPQARRAVLARGPLPLAQALDDARDAILRARRSGDPRDLGAAQAALAPWWRDPQAPAAVRLLRASILQSRHDFGAALADLDSLVDGAAPPPVHAQALLMRASLHQLRGRLDAAQADCGALAQPAFATLGDGVRRAAAACTIELRSLGGDARRAARELDALAAAAGDDAWLALVRAELAERLGDEAAAQRHYEAAAAGGEVYALAALADWLLDRGRARQALAVLDRGPDPADALLLRRAIAWRQLGDARADAAASNLRARFEAVRRRGDAPHLREEARVALELDRDAPRALALARAQWAQQKEPADAVLLWRAARATGGPAVAQAAEALRAWIPDPAGADVRLAEVRLAGAGAAAGGRP